MKLPKFDIRYLYVMYSHSFLWRFKCGISGNIKSRRAQLEKELSEAMNRDVRVRVAMSVPSLFSESQEAKIHRWLNRIRDRGMVRHSGYSEWFWYWHLNFCVAVVVWAVCYWNGHYLSGCYVALITVQPFYPLPAVIIVAAVFIIEIALFIGAVVLIVSIFSQLYQLTL